jgi:hypothetical protein
MSLLEKPVPFPGLYFTGPKIPRTHCRAQSLGTQDFVNENWSNKFKCVDSKSFALAVSIYLVNSYKREMGDQRSAFLSHPFLFHFTLGV